MSDYSVRRYIEKKFDDIYKETTTKKAYDLGLAVGIYYGYTYIKSGLGKELADKCFSNLNDNDEYTKILRTLIELDNKENVTKAEKMLERYEYLRKPEKKISDEDRDLLEEFMEFLYKKEK